MAFDCLSFSYHQANTVRSDAEERVAEERVAEERVAEERVAEERVAEEHLTCSWKRNNGPAWIKVLPMANSVFSENLFIHLPYPVGMWNFAQTFPLAIFHEIRWQKSCDIIKSTFFFYSKFW